jgi:cellobiose dehydrogenase (acceptor)
MALPPTALTVDTHEYIGLIVSSSSSIPPFLPLTCLDWFNAYKQGGWTGIVHGDNLSASMLNHLMLIAWPTGVDNQIATSFRYAGYV